MINNLFEKALQNKEVNEFFNGEGSYFVRNRETGEHSYNTQISGAVVNFIDNDDHRMKIFSNVFKNFISDANPADFEAIQSILSNISAYFIAKNRGLFPESNLLISEDDPAFKEFNGLLNELTARSFTSKEQDILKSYSAFLHKHNALFLAALLTKNLPIQYV
jgi:hypothetical protein